jgi:hypothetical protein
MHLAVHRHILVVLAQPPVARRFCWTALGWGRFPPWVTAAGPEEVLLNTARMWYAPLQRTAATREEERRGMPAVR